MSHDPFTFVMLGVLIGATGTLALGVLFSQIV